jgi:dGTPase
MDLADDIAFGVHDLEDALALRLIDEADFRTHVPDDRCAGFLDHLKARYSSEFGNDVYGGFVAALFGEGGRRKRVIGRMVHHLITNCTMAEADGLSEPLIRYRAIMNDGPATFLRALKDVVRNLVILSPSVQQLEFKGQTMVVAVFEALSSDPRAFLPRDTYRRWERSETPARVICDHIAGMTDVFLLKTYERLFAPRMGSVFDRL